MKKLRVWHAMIAILATATYLSEDAQPLHQLLGYGVVILIVVRVLLAVFGSGALGLKRFYPSFHDLRLGTLATHPAISRTLLFGIAVALLAATTTGVLMDRGEALKSVETTGVGVPLSQYLVAGNDHEQANRAGDDDHGEGENDDEEGLLGEVHELFANLLIGLVALHVSYLILFKWPLARFMLFIRQPTDRH